LGVITIYALIETGGKQYKVEAGQVIDVDRLVGKPGEPVELNKVLLIADGERTVVGTPTIEGAKVFATYKEEFKGDKIIVFHYKSKVRHRNKTGHRQIFSKIEIDKIVEAGGTTTAVAKKVRRSKKEVTESGT
jgi:large subunit ribosomal protein L21